MNSRIWSLGSLSAVAVLLAGTASAVAVEYEVEIRNVSRQVVTPPLVVVHSSEVKLFTPGEAANAELATQAETGNPMPLADKLRGLADVSDVVTGSEPLMPGSSVTLSVSGPAVGAAYLSMTAMLATTNDAFAALNNIPLSRSAGQVLDAPVYDAGSEANNELCSHIPGPPCPGDSGNAKAANGAEGFISIHPGIRGVGDLDAALLDWRNPALQVTVRVAGDNIPISVVLSSDAYQVTVPQMREALQAAGFTGLTDIQKDGRIFETLAQWNGSPVRVRVNAETGRITLM